MDTRCHVRTFFARCHYLNYGINVRIIDRQMCRAVGIEWTVGLRIFADRLTLIQSEGADYDHHITMYLSPSPLSYGPAVQSNKEEQVSRFYLSSLYHQHRKEEFFDSY